MQQGLRNPQQRSVIGHLPLYIMPTLELCIDHPVFVYKASVLQSTDQFFLFALLWTTQYTARSTTPSTYKYSTCTRTSRLAHIILTACPLAFNLFHTSYLPLYDVTDFYEHPQGYAQLQQPLGSPHCQPLLPSPDPDAEMSSPTHASSSIDYYGLLQPPSPRDDPMKGTPPSDHLPFRDIEPVDYMSYGETLQ